MVDNVYICKQDAHQEQNIDLETVSEIGNDQEVGMKPSDSEMEVLSTLLETGPATAVEVHGTLTRKRPWARSTVVTFLRRLEAKGLLTHSRRKNSRAFVYRPTSKAHAARRGLLRELMNRVFGGNPLPLMASLLEDCRLGEEQIELLRRMLKERTEKQSKRSDS